MFQDLRSPERRVQDEADNARREAERLDAEAVVAKARGTLSGAWQPITSLPFSSFAASYADGSHVLVSDGDDVAIASISKRFGRPMKLVEEGSYALTDNGLQMVGAKVAEFDRPDWWFDWKLTDLDSTDHEMWGKDEVSFVATHWRPLPLPPTPTAPHSSPPTDVG